MAKRYSESLKKVFRQTGCGEKAHEEMWCGEKVPRGEGVS